MGNHVIGFQGVFVKRLGVADGETAKLRFVIEVLHLVTRLIDHERRMVDGIEVPDGAYSHVDAMGRHRLKAAELITSREDKITVVVISHMVNTHHQRTDNSHRIIITRIL